MKVRVKPYKENIARNRAEVLQLIVDFKTISGVAQERNTTYQAAHKIIGKLVKDKYVKIVNKTLYLTSKGKKFSEGVLGKPELEYRRTKNLIRLHDLQFRLKVLSPKSYGYQLERIFKTEIREYTRNDKLGWQYPQYIYNLEQIEVRTTPKHVLVCPTDVYGNTAAECKQRAAKLLFSVIPKIERQLRIKLERKGKINIVVSRQHNALIYNEIAQWFLKKGFELRIYDDRGDLRIIADDSLGLSELEAVHKKYAENDADRIKTFLTDVINTDHTFTNTNSRIDKLVKTSEQLAISLAAQSKIFESIFQMNGNNNQKINKGGDYIG